MSIKRSRVDVEECSSATSSIKRLHIDVRECSFSSSSSTSTSYSSSCVVRRDGTWAELPDDLWEHLFDFLSGPEFYRVETLSRSIRRTLQSPALMLGRKNAWTLRAQRCLFRWLQLETETEQVEFIEVMYRSGAVFSGGRLLHALLYGDDKYQDRSSGDPEDKRGPDLDFYVPASPSGLDCSLARWIDNVWVRKQQEVQRDLLNESAYVVNSTNGVVACFNWKSLHPNYNLHIELVYLQTAYVNRILDVELSSLTPSLPPPPPPLPLPSSLHSSAWTMDSSGCIRVSIPGMDELVSRAHHYDIESRQPYTSRDFYYRAPPLDGLYSTVVDTSADLRAILRYIVHGFDFSFLRNALYFGPNDSDTTSRAELSLLDDTAIRLCDCKNTPVPPLERRFWQRFFLTLSIQHDIHPKTCACTRCEDRTYLKRKMLNVLDRKRQRIGKYQARGFPCVTHERFFEHLHTLLTQSLLEHT